MPKLRLADYVTLGNALCGTLAIFFAASGELALAARLIAFGIFLDALDGPIARWQGTTEEGQLLDRVSDRITQAFAPAVLVAALAGWQPLVVVVGAFVVLVGLVRLVRKDADPANPVTVGVTLGPVAVFALFGFWFGWSPWLLAMIIFTIAVLNLTDLPIHIPQSVRKPVSAGTLISLLPTIFRALPFATLALAPAPWNAWTGLTLIAWLILFSVYQRFVQK